VEHGGGGRLHGGAEGGGVEVEEGDGSRQAEHGEGGRAPRLCRRRRRRSQKQEVGKPLQKEVKGKETAKQEGKETALCKWNMKEAATQKEQEMREPLQK